MPFGVNGIRINDEDGKVYVSVTAEDGTLDGVIYRLPLVNAPVAADLEEFHRYPFVPGLPPVLPGPDGIAFGRSEKLYVALAGTSQISVLRAGWLGGGEVFRAGRKSGRITVPVHVGPE